MVIGEMMVNCYIVSQNNNEECIVIDPGEDGEQILRVLREKKLRPVYIINTHGHVDHIGANVFLAKETGSKILIHQNDANMLTDPTANLSTFFGTPVVSKQADYVLGDGEILEVNDLIFEVIHTPGHTKGGICLKINNYVFTGDTLFAGGIGRTDLPDGSQEVLIESINNRLMVLNDDTIIYPGHGESSTIGIERRSNPFLR
jgi:glyoxylase-like metal-dependent hydrolase (beta-lactamase superfamily II)